MSTTTASPRTPSVRWLIESRPPSLTWLRPTLPPSNQPPLDLSDHEIDRAEITRPNDRGVRVSTVRARWVARPRRGLPDAQQWSGALALAVIQTLLGQRSVAQATRQKCALAMVSPPLEPGGMGSTCESLERRLIVISGLGVRRRPAQRLGISAFRDHVDCCPYGMLLCTGPPGRSWAGQRVIGFTELLASHDHDRLVITRLVL
jgi:hypothetical protein